MRETSNFGTSNKSVSPLFSYPLLTADWEAQHRNNLKPMKQTLLLLLALLLSIPSKAADGEAVTEGDDFFILASDTTLDWESKTENGVYLTKNVGTVSSCSGTIHFWDAINPIFDIEGNTIGYDTIWVDKPPFTQLYYYLYVLPSASHVNPSIAFKLPGTLQGKYGIYLVTVPFWVKELNFEKEKRAYRFNVNIYERGTDNFPSQGDILINPVDSSEIFTTPIPSDIFEITDTTYLGIHEFKENCSDAIVQIQTSVPRMTSEYSREMLITGIILKDLTDGKIIEMDGICYLLNENLHVAQVRRNKYEGDVNIPVSIEYKGNQYTVNSIYATAFKDCNNLTSVKIPNSVTVIGSNAFENCSNLASIDIPSSVTIIGSNAFQGCSSLISVEIPNSVTAIGGYAFYGCI